MHINELSSERCNKYVTVTMSYEECRDIANGLFYMSKEDPYYKAIYRKSQFLFDMIKEGMVQEHTIKAWSEAYCSDKSQNMQDKGNN